ncbi:MAG: hypothetical protein K0Q49_2163 [Haloplasmataceae bacterium]|jgi:L-lactate utilization protein LutB|nr:hypothetical protein [Haloplasmataceae bacterium]
MIKLNINIEQTIKNLENNNIRCIFLNDSKNIFKVIDNLINDKSIVGIGGSKTLMDLGFVEYLRNRDLDFLDRYKENIDALELKQIFRKSFFADYYLTSSNAITEAGELFNIDGRGNRVAAMLYGPDQVIIVAGVNKIVKDVFEALERTKKIAAPLNAVRLNIKTPCAKTLACVDCKSDDRICRDYVLIKKPQKGRFTLILINENLGY